MSVAGYLVAAVWLFPAPLMPTERVVSRVGGMFEDRARRELERVGLAAEVTAREPDPLAAAGTVIWQDPPPGVAVPRGTAVSLVLSSGVPKVMVPDIRGYDPDFAQRMLAAVGLRVDGIDTLDIKGVPPGAAGGTDPQAGDSVLIGRSVFLHLAR
jgi:serine/threonine-protein kinase